MGFLQHGIKLSLVVLAQVAKLLGGSIQQNLPLFLKASHPDGASIICNTQLDKILFIYATSTSCRIKVITLSQRTFFDTTHIKNHSIFELLKIVVTFFTSVTSILQIHHFFIAIFRWTCLVKTYLQSFTLILTVREVNQPDTKGFPSCSMKWLLCTSSILVFHPFQGFGPLFL